LPDDDALLDDAVIAGEEEEPFDGSAAADEPAPGGEPAAGDDPVDVDGVEPSLVPSPGVADPFGP